MTLTNLRLALLMVIGSLVSAPAAFARILVDISEAIPDGNGKASVEVRLDADLDIGGVQNDILFDSTIVRLPSASTCRINPIIGDRQPGCEEDPVRGPCKTLSRDLASCGTTPTPPGCEGQDGNMSRFRAIIAATAAPNNNPLPRRTVLYTCVFDVVDRHRLTTPLHNSELVGSTTIGGPLAVDGYDGAIGQASPTPSRTLIATVTPTVTATRIPTATRTATAMMPIPSTPTATRPPRTATSSATSTVIDNLSPTTTPTRATSIELQTHFASEDEVVLEAVFHSGGRDVGGIQSDIWFDSRALQLDSAAACSIGDEIGTTDPRCEEEPVGGPCKVLYRRLVSCGDDPAASGCENREASTHVFRAIIAAVPVPNRNPVPDGSVLYACRFRLQTSTDRAFIWQGHAFASDPYGARVPIAAKRASLPPRDNVTPTRLSEPPTRTPTPSGVILGGRIQMVVGESQLVPAGPAYVAIGDLDNDGIKDAAFSCVDAERIVIGLSDGERSFDQFIPSEELGRVGDLVLLHANTDDHLDVASTDQSVSTLGGGIFVAAGRGDGTLGIPNFVEATTHASGIVAADFDGQNGPDIATANGRRVNFQTRDHDVSIILNRGQNRGFDARWSYDIGSNTQPEDIETGDFDNDGHIDLAVLDTDPGNREETVVLRWRDPNEIHLPIVDDSWNPVTGQSPVAMVVGDFNLDGAPDIAMANDGGVPQSHSLSILINRTSPIGGTQAGFHVSEPISVPCPSDFNGVPTGCSIRDLGSGDFNQDGVADLVLAIDTQADDPSMIIPGILTFFEGLGDGRFDFSTSVNIESGPGELAVGDLTGDQLDDVVVTSVRLNRVTIVRRMSRELRGEGMPCRDSNDCESGDCVDRFCCNAAGCSGAERCDIPAKEGMCSALGLDGDRCERRDQCEWGSCVEGFCCAQSSCAEGQLCTTGVCRPTGGIGEPCNFDEQCDGASCVDGYCCHRARCWSGQRCSIPGSEGFCAATLDLAVECDHGTQCASSFCTDGVCCRVEDCGPERSCGVGGFCDGLAAETATPLPTTTPNPIGFPCARSANCTSGFCVDGSCCERPRCAAGESCGLSGSRGYCAMNYEPAAPCIDNAQCAPGLRCNLAEGVCCESAICDGGASCRVPGHEGVCFSTPTATPTRRAGGEPCTNAPEQHCAEGYCVDDTCCIDSACPPGERCDILGEKGRCLPPLQEGLECVHNTDCLPGLVCRRREDSMRCTLVFATPTMIPTAQGGATPAQVISTTSTVDDGCAVQTSTSSNLFWPIVALSLPFVRRRWTSGGTGRLGQRTRSR